jgi:hypothetical protein
MQVIFQMLIGNVFIYISPIILVSISRNANFILRLSFGIILKSPVIIPMCPYA